MIRSIISRAKSNYKSYRLKCRVKRNVQKRLGLISSKNKANILFVASSVSMWRYGEIAKALQQDSRFNICVGICPYTSLSDEARAEERQNLDRLLSKSGLKYCILDTSELYDSFKHDFRPDIIFYPQPYDGMIDTSLHWRYNLDCLLGYVPYYIGLSSPSWACNLPFHNLAWRQYLPSELHAQEAIKHSDNRGKNVVVVGDTRYKELTSGVTIDPWKDVKGHKHLKRLIWAPHFRIESNKDFNRPDFIWMAEVMLEIAEEFKDDLQIAFKPHPALKTALYKHPDWGVQRTNDYYSRWSQMANTQLEEGSYIDLFKTSDALIHNCGSFSAEYLYLNKPVAYITTDLEAVISPLHLYGRNCIAAHYIIKNSDEIRRFIDQVVIQGNDEFFQKRSEIIKKQLTPPSNKTVAQNVYDDMIKIFH